MRQIRSGSLDFRFRSLGSRRAAPRERSGLLLRRRRAFWLDNEVVRSEVCGLKRGWLVGYALVPFTPPFPSTEAPFPMANTLPPAPPFRWDSLNGPWRGTLHECYGSPVWTIHFDLTFQENGDFSGPCVFKSYPRYTPDLPERTVIEGFGAHTAEGTTVVTGVTMIRELMIFLPLFTLSMRGKKWRLEGPGSLIEARDGVSTTRLLAAARRQEPGVAVQGSEEGGSLDWLDDGMWRIRQLSAADRARDRLRARVHKAIGTTIPDGATRHRTRVATRCSPDGPGWVAEAEVDYTPRGADEQATHTASATGKSGKEALIALIAQLGA
jgi:hypothetical protein